MGLERRRHWGRRQSRATGTCAPRTATTAGWECGGGPEQVALERETRAQLQRGSDAGGGLYPAGTGSRGLCVCETVEVCGGAMPGVVRGAPHCFMCPGSSQTSLPLTPHTSETFLQLQSPGQWLGLVLGELLSALPSPSISQPFRAPVCWQERILHEAPEVVH